MHRHRFFGQPMALTVTALLIAMPQAAWATVVIDSTGGPYLLSAGEDLHVAAAAHDTDAFALTSQWRFANGGSVGLPALSGFINWASIVGATGGLPRNQPFDFGLTVSNGQGGFATSLTQLTIYDSQPIASFTISPNPAPLGSTLSLDASSSFSPDPRRALYAYQWDINPTSIDFHTWQTDFSGRTVSLAGAEALAFFPVPGIYNIGLKVVDDAGHAQGLVKTLTVSAVPEAPTWLMLLAGLLGLGAHARRRLARVA